VPPPLGRPGTAPHRSGDTGGGRLRLGCVVAHLASGVHPFASRSDTEWILRVQCAEPDLSGLPADLNEVVRAALARDLRDRPSAGELATICRAARV
jgi:hypothetical protein